MTKNLSCTLTFVLLLLIRNTIAHSSCD